MVNEKTSRGEKLFAVALIGIMALVLLMIFCGCQTPDTIKQCPPMIKQAIETTEDNLGDNASILVTKPLKDAKGLLVPLETFLGAPDFPVKYDPETNQAELLAAQAQKDAEQANFIKGLFADMTKTIVSEMKNVFPKLPLGVTWEMVIYAILGMLGIPAGVIGGKKIATQIKKKNGNGKGKKS